MSFISDAPTRPPGTSPVPGRDTHTVPEGAPSLRLDHYAARVLERLISPSQAYKALKSGELLLNGQRCEPSRRVRPGDQIELWGGGRRPPPVWERSLEIVFQDDDLAVVHKPAGPWVNGNRHHTVENALPFNLSPSTAPDALAIPRPVHRLDARTGGLLLVARSATAAVELGRQFEEREVHKRYRALLIGRLEGEGVIDQDIEGRPSQTRYRAIEHTRSLKPGWVTTLDAWPLTGRTHQIRRHMASLGHPVLGDEEYGIEGLVLFGQGLFLWAVEIRFRHPRSGLELNFEVPEPAKFLSHRLREDRRWRRVQEEEPIVLPGQGGAR